MFPRATPVLISVSLLWMTGGCRMSVPIHVWQPPKIASTVGSQVVLQAVVGPPEIAEAVEEKLLAGVPQDRGRATTIVLPDQLQRASAVASAAASMAEPSDILLASAARHQGADFLLRGEIIEHPELENRRPANRLDQKQRPGSKPRASALDVPQLSLSWTLTSLDGATARGGQPVVVDLETAVDRYPDLALLDDPQAVLTSAAARETYRLFTPSIDRHRVQLACSYLTPGSRELRRGNAAARSGQWGEAERIWQQVIDAHPNQPAALHNLALAAAAGQDFSRAKALARRAIRLQPTPLHQQTLVWIELRQRDYHRAFQLPDPPEGWFVTRAAEE